MEFVFVCSALLVSVAAGVWDVREQRIPNSLTYPALLAGVAGRTAFLGWHGLSSSVLGLLLAGGIFFVLYAVRATGAGDVKLMAALGAIVGAPRALEIVLAAAVAGGVLAVFVMVYRRKVLDTLRNMAGVVGHHARFGLEPHPDINLLNPATIRLPYGLAIAAGTCFAFVSLLWR
jgi:prepilin peptidase CpaA